MTVMRIVTLRVVCTNPPEGEFGLQADKTGTLTSDLTAEVRAERNDDGTTRFKGPAVNGKKGDEFVYLALRDSDGGWQRRWKLSVEGVQWSDADVLQATVEVGKGTRPETVWKPAKT